MLSVDTGTSSGGIDWATVSQVAVALTTLVLAWLTLKAVRAANKAARVAEAQLAANERPLLLDVPPHSIDGRDEILFQTAP